MDYWSALDSVSYERFGEYLRSLPPPKAYLHVRAFFQLLSAADIDRLWAAANIIMGGCSDDLWLDFRAWLVAQGLQFYSRAVTDPDTLADVSLPDWEALQRDGENFLSIHLNMSDEVLDEVPELGLRSRELLDIVDLDASLPRLRLRFG